MRMKCALHFSVWRRRGWEWEWGWGHFLSFFLSHTVRGRERTWEVKVKKVLCFCFYCVPERVCVKTVLTFEGQWSCNKRWNTRAHRYMYKMWCACAHKNCCVIVFFSFRWMPLFFPFLEIHNILVTHSWQIIINKQKKMTIYVVNSN